MKPLLTCEEIRAVEAAALARGENLMERAGLAAAKHAMTMLALAQHHPPRVVVLAGGGNNGGDALEVAVHLRERGCMVEVIFTGSPVRMPPDAAHALAKWNARTRAVLPQKIAADLIVDGLFGIGFDARRAAMDRPLQAMIETVNGSGIAVLALDLPSGLAADSGSTADASPGACIRATRTVTFIADKPGLHTQHGIDMAGEVVIESLDLPLPPSTNESRGLIERADFATLLKPRLRNSHKGSFGTVAIIGGAAGMGGAALLAGRAALHLGAGKVVLGLMDEAHPALDPLHPELMLRAPAQALAGAPNTLSTPSVIACGPGMGETRAALGLLEQCVATDLPLVLDADALNLIAAQTELATAVARRQGDTWLTPHPLEAARLLGTSVARVQADRIAAVTALAKLYRANVVLKGAGSVLAWQGESGNGQWAINPTGNPGMASGGMGDVLTGLLAALVAQRGNAACWQVLAAAVYLHGAAADQLVKQGCGPIGLTASETIAAARKLWNAWAQSAHALPETA